MKNLLTPKSLWRGILVLSIAAVAVFISAIFNLDELNAIFSQKGIEVASGKGVQSVSVTLEGDKGARVDTTKQYTISASGLDQNGHYRLVLVVDGHAQPGWRDVSGVTSASQVVSYRFREVKYYDIVGVVQGCNAEFSWCDEGNGGSRSAARTVSLCGCSDYTGCGTSCNFNAFDSCRDEAQASGIPMIQVCRPNGPVCEDARNWQPICHEELAPAGTCTKWRCNNEQCTPGQTTPSQKPLTVITRCEPGTSPVPRPDLAGNVEISLVNLSPNHLRTPNSDPASASSGVSVTEGNQVYAVRAQSGNNQGRVFSPAQNNLGCTVQGTGFEWCPWSSLPDSGGTFVFEIDCSEPVPPPPPPPPEKSNPSCDAFTIRNTRTGENCTGTTCYAEPGDQLVLTASGTAGDWAASPNVVRYAYMGSTWQPISGNLERGDWAYGSAVNWSAPTTDGNYLVTAATGWVGPLGDGNPFNDDGRLCTAIAPNYYVWKPSGNNYANLFGQTCSHDTCTKTLVVQNQPTDEPEVEILKSLVTQRIVEVGDPVTFRLQATNIGNTVLTTIPVTDEFETEYLDYATATIAPTRVDEHGNTGLGTIEWSNILGAGEVLFPGQSKTWDVTFTAIKPTVNITDGDADNCMWIYDHTVRDDQGNLIPPEDLVSCDYVIIVHRPGPVEPAVDIEKVLTTAGDIYIGDEVKFDLVITNTGPIDLVEYDLIDDYDASYLRYLRAVGDKKESTGEWSITNVTVPFSAGGGHLVASDLQDIFGVLNPNDQIYVHITFEAIRAGTTTDTARINAKGDNGEWVYDDDSASVVIISVKPPKTGASEMVGLGILTLLGSGSAAKVTMILKKKALLGLFK